MPTLKHILFPVDFSARCEHAAPQVRLWAEHFSARVVLLHAAEHASDRTAKAEALRELVARHFEDASTILLEGAAARAIVDTAVKERSGLIMMPTHGGGVFRQLLIGATTAKVLHDAPCPVWTAAHLPSARTVTRLPRTILCGVDRSPAAAGLIQWAGWLAAEFGAEMKLVHALPAVDDTSPNRGERAVRRYWQERVEQELVPQIKKTGCSAELIVKGGGVAETLAAVAREHRADLLVIGRGRANKKLGRLRTHSLSIVAKSPCPVVSV
jgi:nucleotide-binding universal stress UspA family protein